MPAWHARSLKNCCSEMGQPAYHLRPALKRDSGSIRRLIWRVHINPTNLDWRHFWVAVDPQDRLLGCGQLKPHPDGSLEMASIAVQPDYRRLGIAHAIIDRLMSQSGVPLYLRCAARMRAFYERFGFQVIPFEEMPAGYRRDWKIIAWIRKNLFPKMPGMCIMRLDEIADPLKRNTKS